MQYQCHVYESLSTFNPSRAVLPLAFVDSVESSPIAAFQAKLAVYMQLIYPLECELVHTRASKWVAPLYRQLHTSTCKGPSMTRVLACSVEAAAGKQCGLWRQQGNNGYVGCKGPGMTRVLACSEEVAAGKQRIGR